MDLWKIVVVALVSALLGTGIGYFAFSHWGNSNPSPAGQVTNGSGKAGTTQISNVTVKSHNQMTTAFKKVKG